MPSPLFDALFLIALFVPIVMYATGLLILFVSLVVKQWRLHETVPGAVEARAR